MEREPLVSFVQGVLAALRRARFVIAIGLIMLVFVAGTIGYSLLEGWPFLDALYMTVITVTTIGYGETRELSNTGRIFTLALISTSFLIVGYALSQLTAFLFEGEIKEAIQGHRMERKIKRLRDHIILCGCGSTGIHIAEEFIRTEHPFVIVDPIDQHVSDLIEKHGDVLYLQGDATDDEVLRMAGIDHAIGLVAAVSNDKDNVFIVLTARSLNPTIRIVSRLIEDDNYDKLRRAGADDVISPNIMGGLRIASVMLRPTTVSLMDELMRVPDQSLSIEEVRVEDVPAILDKSLGEANIASLTNGLLVVAIVEIDKGYTFNPGAKTMLRRGDVLIVMGNARQRETLRNLTHKTYEV